MDKNRDKQKILEEEKEIIKYEVSHWPINIPFETTITTTTTTTTTTT